ncbi:uncharacterized protein LOC110827337 isoform X2 [Zootermopsis nevadensis]|nr:uncharacterized protein LOC110827337 isoform X2 [Zootermopsis nevadensis]
MDLIPPDDECNIYKWHADVVGYNMDVTVNYLDLDEVAGNYLIISPGPSLVQDEASVVLTGIIQTTKKIRVMDHNEMSVLLVTQNKITNGTRKNNGFQLSYEAFGELTTEPSTTTSRPTPPPAPSDVDDDISVYVSGITPPQFYKKRGSFKEVVAEMANDYCSESKNIQLQKNATSSDVRLQLITECPRTWPNWETCIKVNLTIPLHVLGSDYQLDRTSLEEMWNKYAKKGLEKINLKVYQVPDNEEMLHLWLYISLGVVAIFTLLMIVVWRLDLFNTSNKKGTAPPFGRVSTASTDSWISNSYQEVPPMTDLLYDDTYNKTRANEDNITSPKTLNTSHDERTKSLDEFGAAFYFQNRVSNIGYDNPSFDVSSEQHHQKNTNTDDFSSDDESMLGANTMNNTRPNHDHLYEAPKQVTYQDQNNESAL